MDARRMEIFTAIYKNDLTLFFNPCAIILDEFSFEKILLHNKIIFFGSGSTKWKSICKHSNAAFENVLILPDAMAKHSNMLYLKKHFTELAYCEPIYLKEFQTVIKIAE